MLEHAPAFVCGAITAWVVQFFLNCVWWGPEDPQVDFQRMVEALHAEAELARQLLSECQAARHAAVTTSAAVPTEAPISTSPIIDLAGLHTNDTDMQEMDGRVPGTVGVETASVVPGTTGAPSEESIQYMWNAALYLLDTGLVYFCLRQCMSQAAQVSLEANLMRVLDRSSWLAYFHCAESKPVKTTESTEPSLSHINPAGDAVLVRRARGASNRRGAPGSGQHQGGEKRPRSTLVVIALASVSLASAAAVRLVVRGATAAGLLFLTNLFTYAIITVRTCLVVLLLLF